MRVGIILTGDSSWAGGLYYSLNIIKLLQRISLTKQLKLVVFINKHTGEDVIGQIPTTNLKLVDLDKKNVFYKLWCKFMGVITRSNYRFVTDINSEHLDILYPVIHYEKGHQKLNCKVYYWLFDFQHKFLPELFSFDEIHKRDHDFKKIIDKAEVIVLSSYDSKKHLEQFYPECKAKLFVYNFVSLIEKTSTFTKMNLPENYFVVCNQFWPHKNHLVVLQAIDLLVKNNKNIHVVFTGKYDDIRNKDYVAKLNTFISEKQLDKHITFTGFIAREVQIGIIQKAKAVIQPSLFEGWSTVIEDAKALNKFLIVSEIPIHREQIAENVYFFEPHNALELSNYMDELHQKNTEITKADYTVNIQNSQADLEKLLYMFS